MRQEKYYSAYEDRYRRVYSQGVPYWSGDPAEIKQTTGHLQKFLDYYQLLPPETRMIEFGCGEGYLAEYLIGKGYQYHGVDISPSAIEKARNRIEQRCNKGTPDIFMVGDITHSDQIPDRSYHASVDNYCLHMLLLDSDREKYLAQIARILAKDGKAFFHENYQENRFEGTIETYDEFLQRFTPDLKTLEDRQVYADGQYRTIKLPRLAARFNNEEGYRGELLNAGLRMESFQRDEYTCIFYAARQ